MATINTADDLIEVLRNDGRVRSAVRRELLTDELIAMPEKVNKMVEAQTAMQESLTAMQQTQDSMLKTQDSMLKTQDSMLKTQTAILKDIKGIRKEQKSLRKTHVADREESIQEMHRFRGNYAVSAAAKDTVGIAMPFARQKNMRQIRCDEVSPGELKDLIANCEDEQVLSGFSDDDLNYFPQVDIAFGVMGRRERSPVFYVAVEAGYTADSGDVDRVVVRAKILGAITGKVSYAVVASVHINPTAEAKVTDDVEKYLASHGDYVAFWHRIDEKDLQPASPR
jgi:hypothetical protein